MSKSKVFLGIGVGLGVLGAVAGTLAAVNKVKKSKEVEEDLSPSDEFISCGLDDCEDCDCAFSFTHGFDEDSPFSVEELVLANDNVHEFGYESFVEKVEVEAEEVEVEAEAEIVEEVKPKRRSKSKEKDVEEDGETI